MPPADIDDIDRERSLYRFLTKSARKGERADVGAALARLGLSRAAELHDVADGMQKRLSAMYPEAPDLRPLLSGRTTADQLSVLRTYDWVTAGIYVFGLPPTKTRSGTAESAAHRALKEWAAGHGAVLGAPADALPQTERWFPSGDEADAAFIGAAESLIVEVRPSSAEPHELRRALFSLVSMRAALEAEQSLAGSRGNVRVMLVLEEAADERLSEVAATLSVELFTR